MRHLKKSEGFTILELIVTTALLGLVIVGGMQLYFFASKAFVLGSNKADLQAEMHAAMNRLTEEVRLAHSLQIGPSKEDLKQIVNGQASGDVERFYLYGSNGSVYLETPDGKERPILVGDVMGTDYRITFAPVSTAMPGPGDPSQVIGITLESLAKDLEYALSSEVQVLNLRASGIKGDPSGGAIVFTKTFTEEEYEQARTIRPGCILFRYVYDPASSQLYALRQFRDNYLATNPFGRLVIKTYYTLSDAALSLLEVAPWAEVPVTSAFRAVAELVLLFA
jgi:type II secretory pathway pseudopilin PulG